MLCSQSKELKATTAHSRSTCTQRLNYRMIHKWLPDGVLSDMSVHHLQPVVIVRML